MNVARKKTIRVIFFPRETMSRVYCEYKELECSKNVQGFSFQIGCDTVFKPHWLTHRMFTPPGQHTTLSQYSITFSRLFHDQINFPWLRTMLKIQPFWGIILLDDKKNISSFQTARRICTKIEIPWLFHDLDHFFQNPWLFPGLGRKCSFQIPWLFMTAWTLSIPLAASSINRGYFMENACVRFLFTSCEVS